MRTIGGLMIILGSVLALGSFIVPTTAPGSTTINMGLQQFQMMMFLAGAILALAGWCVMAAGEVATRMERRMDQILQRIGDLGRRN